MPIAHPGNIWHYMNQKVAFKELHVPIMGLFVLKVDSSLKVQLVYSQLRVDLGIHLIAL